MTLITLLESCSVSVVTTEAMRHRKQGDTMFHVPKSRKVDKIRYTLADFHLWGTHLLMIYSSKETSGLLINIYDTKTFERTLEHYFSRGSKWLIENNEHRCLVILDQSPCRVHLVTTSNDDSFSVSTRTVQLTGDHAWSTFFGKESLLVRSGDRITQITTATGAMKSIRLIDAPIENPRIIRSWDRWVVCADTTTFEVYMVDREFRRVFSYKHPTSFGFSDLLIAPGPVIATVTESGHELSFWTVPWGRWNGTEIGGTDGGKGPERSDGGPREPKELRGERDPEEVKEARGAETTGISFVKETFLSPGEKAITSIVATQTGFAIGFTTGAVWIFDRVIGLVWTLDSQWPHEPFEASMWIRRLDQFEDHLMIGIANQATLFVQLPSPADSERAKESLDLTKKEREKTDETKEKTKEKRDDGRDDGRDIDQDNVGGTNDDDEQIRKRLIPQVESKRRSRDKGRTIEGTHGRKSNQEEDNVRERIDNVTKGRRTPMARSSSSTDGALRQAVVRKSSNQSSSMTSVGSSIGSSDHEIGRDMKVRDRSPTLEIIIRRSELNQGYRCNRHCLIQYSTSNDDAKLTITRAKAPRSHEYTATPCTVMSFEVMLSVTKIVNMMTRFDLIVILHQLGLDRYRVAMWESGLEMSKIMSMKSGQFKSYIDVKAYRLKLRRYLRSLMETKEVKEMKETKGPQK